MWKRSIKDPYRVQLNHLYKLRSVGTMNKEQTEIEARKLVQLSSLAVELLKKIGYNALVGVELSKQLLHELIECGAVEDTVTYKEFSNNTSLKKVMLVLMACSLRDKIDESRLYGKGIVSHFDLYHNCGTNPKFNQFIASINYDAEGNPAMVAELMKSRDNLYAMMVRTRNTTIENMELMGTPDKTAERAQKKPAPILTKEDAILRGKEKLGKLAESVQAIESAKRKAIQDDDDDDKDAEMEDTFDETSSVKVTAKGTKRAATAPIDITEHMSAPMYQIPVEDNPIQQKRRRDTLEWVVRVFPDVQSGAVGIGYFYNPADNSGCISTLPMDLDVIKQIYSRPIGNAVFDHVRTDEELLGLPKKKGVKKSGAKASQANDSDA